MVGHFQEFEDEYLETLYEFHESAPGGLVKTGVLAKRLGVSPASATEICLLYTSPSPRDGLLSRMPSSA